MRLKSWLKWPLGAAIGILLSTLVIFFARPLYLPDSFLIRQLQRQIESAANLKLTVGEARFRLRNAVIFRHLTLTDSSGRFILTAKALELHYRPLPLLQRRLHIVELVLNEPRVVVVSRSSTANVLKPSPSPSSRAAQPSQLPFTLDIDKLVIDRASLLWIRVAQRDSTFWATSGLHLEADNLQWKGRREFHGAWRIQQADSLSLRLLKADSQLRCSTPVRFSARGNLDPDSSSLSLVLRLQPRLEAGSDARTALPISLPDLALSCDAVMIEQSDVRFDRIALDVDSLPYLRARAVVQDVGRERRFEASLAETHVDLQRAGQIADDLIQLLVEGSAHRHRQIVGHLAIRESEISGRLSSSHPELKATLRLEMDSISFHDSAAQIALDGLAGQAFFQSHLLPRDSLFIDAGADFQLRSMAIGRATSLPLAAPLKMGVSASLGANWTNPQLQIIWEAAGPWDAKQHGSAVIRADRLIIGNPLASPGLSLEGGGSLEDLPLDQFAPGKVLGTISAALDVKAKSLERIETRLGIFSSDLQIRAGERSLVFAPIMLTASARGTLSSHLEVIEVQEASLHLPPYMDLACAGRVKVGVDAQLTDASLNLDLGELLKPLRPLLPDRLRDIGLVGHIVWTGQAQCSADSAGLVLQQDARLAGSNLSVALPQLKVSCDSLSLSASLRGDLHRLGVSAEIKVPSLAVPVWRDQPYRLLTADFAADLLNLKELKNASLRVVSEELGLEIEARGEAQRLPGALSANWNADARFQAKSPVEVRRSVRLAGRSEANLTMALSPDSTLHLRGRIAADSLSLRAGDSFALDNLSGNLPLSQSVKYDSGGLRLAEGANGLLDLQDPVVFDAFEHQFSPQPSNGLFYVGKLQFGPYQMQNLTGSLGLRQGRLLAPRFVAEAYDGRMEGSALLETEAVSADSLKYQIQLSAQRINSARLPGVKPPAAGEDALITAFARFRGQGLSRQEKSSLEGSLNITQIGRQVAQNLLKFLDPEENEPPIQTYRRYLRRGWGVRVFSFDVKDDFVYASLTLAKPPLAKPGMFIVSRLIGLGSSVTFSRMPLQFFLSGRTGPTK